MPYPASLHHDNTETPENKKAAKSRETRSSPQIAAAVSGKPQKAAQAAAANTMSLSHQGHKQALDRAGLGRGSC